MSEPAERSASVSSISSISLVEIKAETHLVLHAFLERTLSTPETERPGSIGGAYGDHSKFSSKPKDGLDSQAEDDDNKKLSFKELIKQLPRSTIRLKNGSLGRDGKAKQAEDARPSSSSSDEDDNEKNWKQKQRKIRKRLSMLFKSKEKQKKEKEKEEPDVPPPKPVDIPSPCHPPEFYNEVAEKLEDMVKSTKIRTQIPEPTPSAAPSGKDSVIQRLVQVLSSEGDSINMRIQSDPFMRSSLARLSYASFSRLLDTFSLDQAGVAAATPPASPTLQRLAATMEVSRRILTATGTQRLQGHAEHYMENFAPWLKQQGGWENVVDLEEPLDYD
ncbi:uncharacterized protein bcl2l12 [Cololabis saira]|uniref:uncharacterized protein bcl2l12 n=1 Tax=Cololabis saira TaxID=129043 RepID=UPI002AD3EA87|nr:uncharacterized protein bcl2l12 [Cololabis saira]